MAPPPKPTIPQALLLSLGLTGCFEDGKDTTTTTTTTETPTLQPCLDYSTPPTDTGPTDTDTEPTDTGVTGGETGIGGSGTLQPCLDYYYPPPDSGDSGTLQPCLDYYYPPPDSGGSGATLQPCLDYYTPPPKTIYTTITDPAPADTGVETGGTGVVSNSQPPPTQPQNVVGGPTQALQQARASVMQKLQDKGALADDVASRLGMDRPAPHATKPTD